MVKVVTQLGKSRKYATGSVHENATGKFQILDRFLEDGVVMQRFQWLTGEKEGQIEENKEENMNASIYKYEQSRGLLGAIEENKEVVTLQDIYSFTKECYRILRWYEEDRNAVQKNLELMEEKLHVQTNLITDIAKHLTEQNKKLEDLSKRDSKRDEVIKEIENTVDKNTGLIQNITNSMELFQNQQKMMDKLLEKI